MAVVSQLTNFTSGMTVTHTILNSEFANIITNLNSITNDQINSAAAIATSKLEMASGSTATVIFNNTKEVQFKNAAGSVDGYIKESASDTLVIGLASVDRLTFSGTGTATVAGTATRLVLTSSSTSGPGLTLTGGTTYQIVATNTADGSGSNKLIFYNTGGGYNEMFFDSGSNTLNIRGTVLPITTNTYNLGSAAYDWANVYGQNAYTTVSDRRQKKHIRKSDLGLEFIESLTPVSYRWKKGDKEKHYGMIAQDVEQVLDGREFAGLVYSKEVDKYHLRYEEFVPVLIKAVQEISRKVGNLELNVT